VAVPHVPRRSIKARRNQDQVRLELTGHGKKEHLPNGEIFVVTHPFVRPPDVHDSGRGRSVGQATTTSDVCWSSVGVVRVVPPRVPAVHRKVHDARVAFENGLRAVPVMDVPVHNQHAFNPTIHPRDRRSRRVIRTIPRHIRQGLRVPCRNRNVVQDAVAACTTRFGVVAGRANDGKAVLQLSLQYQPDQLA
jgi:hypothetical protein